MSTYEGRHVDSLIADIKYTLKEAESQLLATPDSKWLQFSIGALKSALDNALIARALIERRTA